MTVVWNPIFGNRETDPSFVIADLVSYKIAFFIFKSDLWADNGLHSPTYTIRGKRGQIFEIDKLDKICF